MTTVSTLRVDGCGSVQVRLKLMFPLTVASGTTPSIVISTWLGAGTAGSPHQLLAFCVYPAARTGTPVRAMKATVYGARMRGNMCLRCGGAGTPPPRKQGSGELQALQPSAGRVDSRTAFFWGPRVRLLRLRNHIPAMEGERRGP